MTARELCTDILTYLQVYAPNETPEASDMNIVLRAINRFLESWVVDEYLPYTVIDQEFNLISGQLEYTIGIPEDETPADFEARRPTEILRSWVRLNGVDYQVEVINNEQYNSISMKAIETTFPEFLYYSPDYPLGTIKIWPVPTQAMVINLTTPGIFSTGLVLADAISMPPGYVQALLWNGIAEVAPAFSKETTAEIRKRANDSKAVLKRLNNQDLLMKFDTDLIKSGRRYNIYTDGYQ